MANEINGFGPRNLGQNSSVDSSRGRSEAKGESQRPSGDVPASIKEDDAVTLSSGASQLRELGQSLAETAPFDQGKVDRIKDLISQGEYQVDSAKIAERLRQFENL
ncbi:flagellar biosynthesis anti-sigma factor FlgM [Guyparkeria hydrothermalis]|uniref:flagellar biosynthesis anti-sigma factor FlgM n=1 Tax=Guyparkeria hydrothermalis TaxID=923 RepID=UPI002021855A|nr:flagellar biosynthesis anti-sigma factor FlgM [Guyparkeria hydrothermalis]MCL7743431.1 flagellar biosynthesis anti-sigma factor FlgM [Guyparkeria hydrothermalis]